MTPTPDPDICGNPHSEDGYYDHVCQFPPDHGPVEVLDPDEVAKVGLENVERGQFAQHGDPDGGAWWNHPTDPEEDPNPKDEDPAAVLAERDELREKIAYLRHGILDLDPAELIERITAIGSAEWEAGAWLAERIATERAQAASAAVDEAIAGPGATWEQ